ncbi:MAG: phage morphogenesis protein [Psychroserpens sp.]|uniref:phage morphogenesis protein n=1 Tax=Psychroserpens sp. TaxID=2020870 RepID=UPI003C8F6BCC
MADGNLKDLQRMLNRLAKDLPIETAKIIEVEGLGFINKNFRDQGFNTGSGVKTWDDRKTKDKAGRNITHYRTNRRGRAGTLNKYGRKIEGRAILVGHKTGGDKLKNSFRARRSLSMVKFITYKDYAKTHNEGLGHHPERRFMGPSAYLDKKIAKKLTRRLDRRFK